MFIVIYFRFIYIITTTSYRYCKCYTLRFALLRFACHCIVQYTIHMHTYRIVSYNISYTCHRYGTESYHSNNKCMSYIIPQPCTHTTTEKANPFFTSRNRAGGWAFSKSFPLRGYGFKIRV